MNFSKNKHKKKYRLQEMFENLTREEFNKKHREIEEALGKSYNFLFKLRMLPAGSKRSAYLDDMKIIAEIFGVSISDLINDDLKSRKKAA